MMFSQSVSSWKTMILAVALIVSIAVAAASSAGDRSFDMCVLQKNTIVEEYKLSTLDRLFGEILTTESNDNIYVVSICRPVPEMFYDPRKLSGAIKLTPEGNTIDLGHINQSNVVVNENSIVLTYVGGDRDRNVEDTCKGLRWTTYLTFLCDPTAIHDILILIDEDPDQPEICQVWFEVTTSKICNRLPHLPLVVMEKDFSTLKHQTDHVKYRAGESTNFNEIPSIKNAFNYGTSYFNKNNKSSNIENKEKPNINDFYNKFNKPFSNEHFSASKENKTTNDEIKNENTTRIISKDQKNQSENENKYNFLNKNNISVYEKNEKKEGEGSNWKTNTPEDKMSVDHENNKLWIKKHNTVPGSSSKKEYSYPGKNETISHYNIMKKYLNQYKNSEGKYENSVLRESTKYDENKDSKLNQEFPENVSNNDMKYKKLTDNENMEKTSRRNSFENQTSNKEMNDSSDNKKPSDNEKQFNQDYSKKSILNNDPRIYNRIPNSDNGIKYKTTDEGKIVNTEDNQSHPIGNTVIIYNNKVPVDVTKENIANQTHSQNNNSESKSFAEKDQKNEIENNPKNVNSSITESTPRADSTTENKPTDTSVKSVNDNTITTTKSNTNDDANQTDSQNNNSESKSLQKEGETNEIVNNPKNVNSSITESTPRADSTTENKPTGSGDKGVDDNTINTTKSSSNDDANQTDSQNNNSESKSLQKEGETNEIVNNPKNVNGSITESTSRADSTTENKPTDSGDKGVDANTINTTKSSSNDDANQTDSQNNNSESKSFQKEGETNEIVNNPKNVNGSITESSSRADSTTENKPTDSGDKGVDANTINTTKSNTNDGNPTIDANGNNTMKNNNNSTSGSDDNTIAVTVKPTQTSPSNAMVNDYTNESGEVNGSSTESAVDGSLNNIKNNNKSEPNGTIINETNNVNKNLQPDESIPVPSAHSTDNDDSDNLKTTTDSTNQSGNGFSFDKLFSTIFPNGIHVSATTIIGALASLTAVTGVVGTAINRFYYKQSGTDQIPFKGTFQSIFNSIKGYIISLCCCCRRNGYDDLEAPDLTNEKTPLLQPKFNVSTPLLVDETSQKSSDSGDNDDSSKQNSSNEYGSMSKEKKPSTSETKYRTIKRKSKKTAPENESLLKNVEEKLINVENNLHGKSIKEVISGKINAIFTEKVKPTIDSVIEKVGKKVESTDEIKKNLDKISKDAALISKFMENDKSTNNTDDVRVDVETKSENNSEKTHLNENESQNAVVQEEIKSITLGESKQSPNVKPLIEDIVSQVPVPDLQKIEKNERASDTKTSTLYRGKTKELIESTQNKKDIVMKNNIEKLQDTVVASPTDFKTKINESKLKFLGLKKDDEDVKKVVIDESIASNKKIENEEDDVQVIEEIIYIDGSDGDEDEEIIEEIIETTTIEDPPDESIPGSGHGKVTVRTTRKISSSSMPGEVRTIEETVVSDGIPENEKKPSGFQFGVGKSGISMSVGDKKLEIGKSGLKLNRSKSNSPKNVEDDEPDKRDTKSPEKSKKSMSLPKIFKRSISQPTDEDIQEAENEPASTKKLSRTGSGLFKLGKSRSKSTVVLKTGDVTMDTDAMSNFMNNERKASRISNVGLGEIDLTVGGEDVAPTVVVRKTSTTTSDGKETVSTETVNISPVDLGFGSARDRRSSNNAETKSNAKTKRENKDKTKLTTLTRPF